MARHEKIKLGMILAGAVCMGFAIAHTSPLLGIAAIAILLCSELTPLIS
jgi:hypothetical protein